MKVSLSELNLKDVSVISQTLKNVTKELLSSEEVCQKATKLLYNSFSDSKEKKEFALCRIFKSCSFYQLPPYLKETFRNNNKKEAKYLTLVGTFGEKKDWCNIKSSKKHKAIPLTNIQRIQELPMVSALFNQIGFAIPQNKNVEEIKFLTNDDHNFGLFLVEKAKGSTLIPDQKSFVIPYGIKSVLGFGGQFSTGDIFATLIFSKKRITAKKARLLQSLAPALKYSLIENELRGRIFKDKTNLLTKYQTGGDIEILIEKEKAISLNDELLRANNSLLKLTDELNRSNAKLIQKESELQVSQKVWEVMKNTKSLSISEENSKLIFERVLDDLIKITDGEYGFVGEVLEQDNGQPYLKTRALTNISWNDETEKLYASQYDLGMEFYNLDTLFGKVITSGDSVIANDPANDPRAGGLPEGHPRMHSFLGVPIKFAGKLIGMVGLANKVGGYDKSDLSKLSPYLDSCSTVIQAFRENKKRVQVEKSLIKLNLELERRNNDLSSFASITSHDLMAPMRKILNFCYQLEKKPSELSDYAKDYFKKIEVSANYAANLIDGILNYSQLGEKKEPKTLIDLNELILKIENQMEQEIYKSGCSIKYKNLPMVTCNVLQMEQLFTNLISNSIKYQREGVPPLIEISHQHVDNNNLRIIIKDNGIGFDNAYSVKIFDPFQRLDGAISTKGSGLGLSICKKIALAHNGDISAEGEINKGAKFSITLRN